MNYSMDSKTHRATEVEGSDVNPTVYADNAHVADYKADAILAEDEEHNMSVLQAVQAYPMASFWAFVMSFTIVGCPFLS